MIYSGDKQPGDTKDNTGEAEKKNNNTGYAKRNTIYITFSQCCLQSRALSLQSAMATDWICSFYGGANMDNSGLWPLLCPVQCEL